ncbi:MAG: hypothetical protein ACTSX8_04550 [Alphaproteobacteria bacterium]
MKLVATRKSEQNESVIDPWTIVHIGVGLASGLTGVKFGTTLALALGYEVAEQVFESSDVGQKLFKTSGPEIPANAALDVVVYMAAWYLGQRWNETG